ncbi:retrovirus-related pol polyprotein from transposon TNT 1-94 [Tanacetum coccineum]|uniref:Retrovirus-related pol polyprotein from transposon TNT 1-94 n=1 Tax=Tanacetum coccineum TaxID=301880 RepID=A0ABQ5I0M7_9ASTR
MTLDEEQLAFLADPRDRFDSGLDTQTLPTTAIFQTNDLDAFDSDCDEAPSASAVLMAKLSTYDSYVLSEIPNYNTYQDNNVMDQSIQEMQYSEQPVFVDDSNNDITSDSNIQMLKLQLSATVESHKNLSTTVEVLKKETKEKEDKYIEEIVDLEKEKKALDNIVYKMGQSVQTMHMLTKPQVFYDENHKTALVIDLEETLDLAEATRLKNNEKQNDPIVKEKRVNIKHIHYGSLNELYKHFVPKKQLSAEQTFWLPILKIVFEQTPVKPKPVQNDLPRQLTTTSMVKQNLLKEKSHLDHFDKVIKVRTKVTGQNERTWRFEHIRKAFEKDVIPFVKSLRYSFADFKLGIYREVYEMKAIFQQLETEVEQCSVDKKYFEIEMKELLIENERLLEQIISQDIVCTATHSYDDLVKYAEMEHSYIDEYIRKKSVSDCTLPFNNSNVIALGMYKLDLKPLSPKLRKNREAHIDYLKKTKEHTDTLRDIVEQARTLKPFDNALDYTCKFIARIQELLVYVSATCLSSRNESEKLVVVTPMNKKRQLRFADPNTSTSNTQKQVDSHNTQTTNKLLLTSTGVNSSTNASGSNPKGNTRNNRISETSSSNQKNNKVEDHPINVNSSLNNKNHVLVCNASTKHAVINANSEFVCSTCNECLFNACHDMCVVDYLNVVNSRTRAMSSKSNKKNEWKPTEGVDLLTGSRGTHLYTLSLEDMMRSSPICLLSKASKTKSWLWHRSKKHTHKPKSEKSIQEKLYLLHMDLYGPMRVESINGKKYILVIVDDSSRNIRTNDGTEFVNQTLKTYYEDVRISHQTSVARTPQQNGVVERQNQTLVESARTMLIFSKAQLFLWAEAVATNCYTKN